MPLNKGCSIAAFRDNISQSIKEGKDRSQAVAIAFSTLKSSCKARNKAMPDIGEIVPAEFEDDLQALLEIILAKYDGWLTEVEEGRSLHPNDVWGKIKQ